MGSNACCEHGHLVLLLTCTSLSLLLENLQQSGEFLRQWVTL